MLHHNFIPFHDFPSFSLFNFYYKRKTFYVSRFQFSHSKSSTERPLFRAAFSQSTGHWFSRLVFFYRSIFHETITLSFPSDAISDNDVLVHYITIWSIGNASRRIAWLSVFHLRFRTIFNDELSDCVTLFFIYGDSNKLSSENIYEMHLLIPFPHLVIIFIPIRDYMYRSQDGIWKN